MNNKEIGHFGESIAAQYLEKMGCEILDRNFCCRMGEIDIVAKEKDVIVFVEVKTRQSDNLGLPREAIDKEKIKHMRRAASVYMLANHLQDMEVRFDVMEVYCNRIEGSI